MDGIACDRHRIEIPYFGWIRIKEKGYIPTEYDKCIVSGWIKKCAGRYYVSALVKENVEEKDKTQVVYSKGIGIDLNVNNFATISDGRVFENVNKSKNAVKLLKRLHKERRSLGRRYRALKSFEDNRVGPNRNGEGPYEITKKNYYKKLRDVDVIYHRLDSLRKDYIRKCACEVVKNNPEYVAIEDLKVTDMVSDNRFGKYITDELFYQFRQALYSQCKEKGIEFRVVNQWYPSTRKCHDCGYIGHKVGVGERNFVCPNCGTIIPRDLNASLNICDSKDYVVLRS